MALGTYGELKAVILDWLDRSNDSETVAAIPDWIRLCEADIRREIFHKNVTRNTTFLLDSAAVTMPADVHVPTSLYITESLNEGPVFVLTPEALADKKRLYPSSGVPRWGSIVNGVLLLVPTPQQSYAATLIYVPAVAPLLAESDTNWVLTNHPDLYLYGALLHSAPWLRDPESIAVWDTGYQRAMAGLEKQKARSEYGTSPLIGMPKREL